MLSSLILTVVHWRLFDEFIIIIITDYCFIIWSILEDPCMVYLPTFLEPKWPLFRLEKALFWGVGVQK